MIDELNDRESWRLCFLDWTWRKQRLILSRSEWICLYLYEVFRVVIKVLFTSSHLHTSQSSRQGDLGIRDWRAGDRTTDLRVSSAASQMKNRLNWGKYQILCPPSYLHALCNSPGRGGNPGNAGRPPVIRAARAPPTIHFWSQTNPPFNHGGPRKGNFTEPSTLLSSLDLSYPQRGF